MLKRIFEYGYVSNKRSFSHMNAESISVDIYTLLRFHVNIYLLCFLTIQVLFKA